jgi:hypothetical protein
MELYSVDTTSQVSEDDRRDALRQPTTRAPFPEVELDLGNGEVRKAEILDVSRTGLRLRSVEALTVGTILTLNPPASAGIRPCSAEVARECAVEDDGPKWFDCGLRFLDLASEERHQWFLRLRHSEAA